MGSRIWPQLSPVNEHFGQKREARASRENKAVSNQPAGIMEKIPVNCLEFKKKEKKLEVVYCFSLQVFYHFLNEKGMDNIILFFYAQTK